jgi:hypothetical protein
MKLGKSDAARRSASVGHGGAMRGVRPAGAAKLRADCVHAAHRTGQNI